MKTIGVRTPATVANLGSGFDLIGLAIAQTADEVIVKPNDRKELSILEITGDDGKLPKAAEENTCTVAIQSLLNAVNTVQGFDISIHKKVGFKSGLGSSASSAVAGVVAVNELLGSPFAKTELIRFALDGEYVASRGYHADNVAPCMLGGITFVQSTQPLNVISLPFPQQTHLVVLYQPVSISTAEARELLPKEYERKKVIQQTSNFGALISGLFTQQNSMIKEGLNDLIATPYRKQLIPHFDTLQQIAMHSGAIGFNISGSGPSVFAWCESEIQANEVQTQWNNYMELNEAAFTIYSSAINGIGAEII